MDNYPEELAPEFEESGAIATPFEVWWARAQSHFLNVPEEVARYWVFEHWGHSPYDWLQSRLYLFERRRWLARDLGQIATVWIDYAVDKTKCLLHGKGLAEMDSYPTSNFMRASRRFPTPIIVLDNCDGHLGVENSGAYRVDQIPRGFVLMEGHRRFNLALYLASKGRLNDEVVIWMMRRATQ